MTDSIFGKCGLALVIAIAFKGVVAPMQATAMELLVPAYFYPAAQGSDWDRLATAARSGLAVTAIMNPASGPGESVNADYARVINALQDAGGRILGYVPSGYIGHAVHPGSSCRPADGNTYNPADVIACAARYQSFYRIDGIFIDEMGPPKGGAPEAKVVAYYARVYDGLKAVNPRWTVFGNPGTAAPESLLRNGAKGGADVLVTFEGLAANYAAAKPASYATRHPASRFAHILIETGEQFDVRAALTQAATRHVAYFYATDDLLPNPYDQLPSYWDALGDAIRTTKAKHRPR